mmetsp:Transcript_4525/g.14153  ORF Transcript_4525/g.14153 Transcript_4525/m.14153 type:complete len:274 (-) Transcript_4525:810-1631(-)
MRACAAISTFDETSRPTLPIITASSPYLKTRGSGASVMSAGLFLKRTAGTASSMTLAGSSSSSSSRPTYASAYSVAASSFAAVGEEAGLPVACSTLEELRPRLLRTELASFDRVDDVASSSLGRLGLDAKVDLIERKRRRAPRAACLFLRWSQMSRNVANMTARTSKTEKASAARARLPLTPSESSRATADGLSPRASRRGAVVAWALSFSHVLRAVFNWLSMTSFKSHVSSSRAASVVTKSFTKEIAVLAAASTTESTPATSDQTPRPTAPT